MKTLFQTIPFTLIFLSSLGTYSQVPIEQKVVSFLAEDSTISCKEYYIKKWTHNEGPSNLDLISIDSSEALRDESDPFKPVSDSKDLLKLIIPDCYSKRAQPKRIIISNKRTVGVHSYVLVESQMVKGQSYRFLRGLFIFDSNGELVRYNLGEAEIWD